MNALLEQFLAESGEALDAIGTQLMALEAAPEDRQLMTELFRTVHTLKGNSGLFEFPEMTRVLHAGEDLMDAVRHGRVAYSRELADRLLDATDLVARMCMAIESGADDSAGLASESVQQAKALRALMAESDSPAAELDGAPPAKAHAPSIPAWVDAARLPEDVRVQALQALAEGQSLHWLRYRPAEECFFQGEDPLHQAHLSPGRLWGGISARAPWPALSEMDAYRCMLDFDLLLAAPLEDIELHFRYVRDQIEITALPGDWGCAPASGINDMDSDALLANVLQAQREVLALSDGPAWSPGRVQAATAALAACLKSCERGAEQASLDAALQQALAQAGTAPLQAWMDHAFPAAESLPPLPSPLEAAEAGPAASEPGSRSARRDDGGSAKTLRVDQLKIDRLMNLIGEMVVAKNALPYLAQRAESQYGVRELSREIKSQHGVINRICDEMQDAIMQVRMLPVSFIFQRFPRLVRDISHRLGKQVELVLEGEDTAADKNIIESLGDPLVHIVRNSLDHGLEPPEQRLAAGKPALGTLRISARQESDRVLIEISDDGAGIDPERVKRKALERGLLDEDSAARLSDEEAINLVFAPGFSTAEVISDLSGRGVGMDVVRSAIERVNGSLSLHSSKGQGTTLSLSLPLSMAVTHVMTIEAGGQRFGVPMDMVVETVRVPSETVQLIKNRMATVLRGRVVPLMSLNEMLNLAAPALTDELGQYAVLVVRIGPHTLGLLIDDFIGTEAIILKPLAGLLGHLRAFAGSALMGNGSVLMVLNLQEVL